MGVKYTSFILPLLLLAWLILSEWRQRRELWRDGLRFILPAVLVAAPWYLRNWVWTGNPFYPFLFGGRGWDAFLAAHYAGAGTGIGAAVAEAFIHEGARVCITGRRREVLQKFETLVMAEQAGNDGKFRSAREQVQKLIQAGYKEAQDILKKHRKQLDLIAAELIKKETVEGDEFEAMMGGQKKKLE